MKRALAICAVIGCGRVAFDHVGVGDDGGDTGGSGDGTLGDGAPSMGLITHFPCDDNLADGIDEVVTAGAAVCSQPGCPTSGLGVIGTSCLFDGNDDFATFANPPTIATNAFTVAYWIYFDTSAMIFDIMFKRHVAGRSWQWFSSLATIRIQYLVDTATDGTGGTSCTMPQSTSTTTWYHVAATYDAGEMRFYIDGALLATCSGPPTVPLDSGPIVIGDDTGPPRLFGRLDDIRIYDRALSTQEIMDLMP